MSDITLSDDENGKFRQILNHVSDWCAKNQWAVGVGEMAMGAGLIYTGVHMGHIHLGTGMLGVKAGGFSPGALASGGVNGGTVGLAGAILGGIGVAGAGGAIGIPAWVLAGGGAAIFGAAGYGVGDAVHHFLNPPINLSEVFTGGSITAIGLALLLDGARRLITDEKFKRLMSSFCNGVVHLVKVTAEVVVDSLESLGRFVAHHPVGLGVTVAAGAAGASIGGGIAAGSVTVLGSHALGGVALSLGLVSAPVWPIVTCAAGGAALMVGTWYGLRRVLS